jgi:hypothetical protein
MRCIFDNHLLHFGPARPGKPTSQSEVGRSPAKRDLDTIVTLLSDALNIWLAFKRTTFNVCAFCMAARTVAALIMTGAFFSSKVLYKSIIRGVKNRSEWIIYLVLHGSYGDSSPSLIPL